MKEVEKILLIPMGSSVALGVSEDNLGAVRSQTWDRVKPFLPLAWHHLTITASLIFCVAAYTHQSALVRLPMLESLDS